MRDASTARMVPCAISLSAGTTPRYQTANSDASTVSSPTPRRNRPSFRSYSRSTIASFSFRAVSPQTSALGRSPTRAAMDDALSSPA
ncbi:MAG: hypothetical protein A4E28_01966 [Methanocella sp. PtaU1.Bin125]|nr:MAG: hypothetical protein A4E28_01966 [Methanocella sp. PtaU1.Bin125]